MMMSNANEVITENVVQVKAGNFQVSGMSAEQFESILKNAGIDPNTISITKKQVKIVDKLNYEDEEKTQAVDSLGHKFDISQLEETEQNSCKKSGLCPSCLRTLSQAAEIKRTSGYRTRQVTDNRPSSDKPGYQIREIIKSNLETISNDEDLLNNLQNKEFCKSHFKLAYPLFLNITNMDAAQVKDARTVNNHIRYSPQIYDINDGKYLLTNDLYAKNLPLFQKFFN